MVDFYEVNVWFNTPFFKRICSKTVFFCYESLLTCEAQKTLSSRYYDVLGIQWTDIFPDAPWDGNIYLAHLIGDRLIP